MSRHTLEDGKTPDPEIQIGPGQHLHELAPPPKLVGDWYKNKLGERNAETFETAFKSRYLDHLTSNEAAKRAVINLGTSALASAITVMCIEESTSGLLLCHRRLLLEHTKDLVPGLKVEIQ